MLPNKAHDLGPHGVCLSNSIDPACAFNIVCVFSVGIDRANRLLTIE